MSSARVFRAFVVICFLTLIPFLCISSVRNGTFFSYYCDRGPRLLGPDLLSAVASSYPLLTVQPCTQQVGSSKSSNDFLFLIHSAVNNSDKRQVLRKHAHRLNVKLVFALGQTSDGIPVSVRHESRAFSDLIIGPFLDTYANLTLKHIFALNWAVVNCPNVDFVAKADDDILINFEQVLLFFDKKYPRPSDLLTSRVGFKVFFGYAMSATRVTRDPGSKWCTRHDEYPNKVYPDYCSGWAYVTTIETITSALEELKTIGNGLWIDDVFVSGILREASGAFLEPLNHLYSLDASELRDWVDGNVSCAWDKLFSYTDDWDLQAVTFSRLQKADHQWPPCSEQSRTKRLLATGSPKVSIVPLSHI